MSPSRPETVQLSRTGGCLLLLLVNLIIFIMLLYGLEFYLGLTAPDLPPAPSEVTNRFRFREREFVVPKPPGVCRIMVLGDSFTWGKGVPVEARYTTRLEALLNGAYPAKNFEVLNFGFPGAPTTRERDSLRDYKDRVEPDLIILGFVLNDPQPKSQNYSPERERFEETISRPLAGWLEEVEEWRLERTADLVRNALDSFAVNTGLVPPWQEALQRVYELDSTEWVQFEQALRDIKTMSDELHLPQPIFAILNQGAYTDRPTDYNQPDEELELYLRWYRQAEETAAPLGFYPINFERELAAQLTGEPMAVSVLDGHPSARVHSIYAQKLFDEIGEVYIQGEKLCGDGG